MKAIAVFPKEQKVKLIDHPEPQIETPTQVKLKILDVGVCGTDREICEFKYGIPPAGSDYLIIGHESLGEVVEVGSAVKDLAKGDLVVTMVRRPCDDKSCMACQAGEQDFCYTGKFKERGINGIHGYMTEYVVEEEKYMNKVPPELRDIGVLTEPTTIAEKAVRELYVIQKRLPWDIKGLKHRVLIVGAGPVGLLGALVFSVHDFDMTVYSLEPETDMRAKLANALGANYVSGKTHDVAALGQQIKGNLDVIFDGSGASKLAFHLFELLGYNSVFVWTGIPGTKGTTDIDVGTIMKDIVLKNQDIVGSVNANRTDFQNAIKSLSVLKQKVPSSDALIQRFKPEDYADLLLKPPSTTVLKSVIQFSE